MMFLSVWIDKNQLKRIFIKRNFYTDGVRFGKIPLCTNLFSLFVQHINNTIQSGTSCDFDPVLQCLTNDHFKGEKIFFLFDDHDKYKYVQHFIDNINKRNKNNNFHTFFINQTSEEVLKELKLFVHLFQNI